MRAKLRIALLCIASTLAGREAFADDPRAEQLYVEGKALAAQGDYASACAKFEESQRIEAAIGTQFNLADCYEHTHRPATALAMYREVARIAQMSARAERQKAAEERIANLEKTAPSIVVQADASVSVARDGAAMTDAERAAGAFVDPGDHVIRATSPKHLPWQTTVHVDEGAAPLVVKVPPLEDEPLPPPPPAPPPPPPRGLSPFQIGAIAAGSAGVVGLAVGGVFGANAIARKNDASCNGVDCSSRSAADAQKLRDAQSAATASTIFFAVGGALALGGVALWIFAPKPKQTALVVRGSSLGVEGTW